MHTHTYRKDPTRRRYGFGPKMSLDGENLPPQEKKGLDGSVQIWHAPLRPRCTHKYPCVNGCQENLSKASYQGLPLQTVGRGFCMYTHRRRRSPRIKNSQKNTRQQPTPPSLVRLTVGVVVDVVEIVPYYCHNDEGTRPFAFADRYIGESTYTCIHDGRWGFS